MRLSLEDDRISFFEYWLRNAYFAQRIRALNDSSEPSALLAGFPVFFNEKRGELVTLLQLPLREIKWCDERGETWPIPTWAQRRRKSLFPPPSTLKLTSEPSSELPYALNEAVLSRVLGIQEEVIGDFLRWVSKVEIVAPTQMIQWVTRLLVDEEFSESWKDDSEEFEDIELIRNLTKAASARLLDDNTRVWPIGLAYDATFVRATHYLQQDLRTLIKSKKKHRVRTAYTSYMEGRNLSVERRAHYGTRHKRALTHAQREAAERFLGSKLTAVQGPPGTGKTELILSLCIQNLIDRMSRTGSGSPPRSTDHPLLIVSSTNNRAVDNVTDPLSFDQPQERLPVALRVGSRIIVESVTIPLLRRAIRWLDGAVPDRTSYDRSRKSVVEAVGEIRKAEDPLLDIRKTITQIEAAEAEKNELEVELDHAFADSDEELVDPGLLKKARKARNAAGRKVRDTLLRFETFRHEEKKRARRAYISVHKQCVEKLRPILGRVRIDFAVPPVPEDELSVEDWLDLVEELAENLDEALIQIDEKIEILAVKKNPNSIRKKLETLTQKIARLEKNRQDPAEYEQNLRQKLDSVEENLFEKALIMRENWAALNKDQLLRSLRMALDELSDSPSLRALGRAHPEVFNDLATLFPAWGCTLLSMGNVFPMEEDEIDRLIIDEAGQCHPAYAVSAIFRARNVMVIGDVNQLQPVIELNEQEESRVLRRLAIKTDLESLAPFRVHGATSNSAQSMANRASEEILSLRDHFRCQPEIIEISNRLCRYNFNIRTPSGSLVDRCPFLKKSVLGLKVLGQQQSYIGSWRNNDEINSVIELVQAMLRCRIRPDQIAVLTPYRGQMHALESAFRSAHLPLERPDFDVLTEPNQKGGLGIALGTLHRFQGGERDIVVLSMTASQPRSLTFTNERVNLVNVAVSRAKFHLIVVGNPSLLSRGKVTGELIKAIPRDGWLVRRQQRLWSQ